MTADPILTLAWLALAHLLADFVIQSNRVATEKFGFGRPAWQALGVHGAGMALVLVPVVLAFGLPGLGLLIVVTLAHTVIDRVKIVWTMRVEAQAMAEALALHEGPVPAASLGTAWTPVPAFLFLLDQFAHVIVILAAWAIFVASAPLTDMFTSAVRTGLGSADPATAHRVVLTAVVLLDLAIINVRAASLFVATLVRPREVELGEPPGTAAPADANAASGATSDQNAVVAGGASGDPAIGSAANSGLGATSSSDLPQADDAIPTIVAAAQIVPAGAMAPLATRPAPRLTVTVASPARVGAAIGVLERLLIVAFVLTNATAAVGFVVAAKTIARFKQLDNRQFAEYYLLGTLASVSIAMLSAIVAAAAFASLGTP